MFRLFSYATPGDGKYYVLGVVSGGLTGIGKVPRLIGLGLGLGLGLGST